MDNEPGTAVEAGKSMTADNKRKLNKKLKDCSRVQENIRQ